MHGQTANDLKREFFLGVLLHHRMDLHRFGAVVIDICAVHCSSGSTLQDLPSYAVTVSINMSSSSTSTLQDLSSNVHVK